MNRLFDAVRLRKLHRRHARWLYATIAMVAASTVIGYCMIRRLGDTSNRRVWEMCIPVWRVRVASDQVVAGLLSERGEFTPLYPLHCYNRPPPGYWLETEKLSALRRLVPNLARHFQVGTRIHRIDRIDAVQVSATGSPPPADGVPPL
jgi:hypothetical protein